MYKQILIALFVSMLLFSFVQADETTYKVQYEMQFNDGRPNIQLRQVVQQDGNLYGIIELTVAEIAIQPITMRKTQLVEVKAAAGLVVNYVIYDKTKYLGDEATSSFIHVTTRDELAAYQKGTILWSHQEPGTNPVIEPRTYPLSIYHPPLLCFVSYGGKVDIYDGKQTEIKLYRSGVDGDHERIIAVYETGEVSIVFTHKQFNADGTVKEYSSETLELEIIKSNHGLDLEGSWVDGEMIGNAKLNDNAKWLMLFAHTLAKHCKTAKKSSRGIAIPDSMDMVIKMLLGQQRSDFMEQ